MKKQPFRTTGTSCLALLFLALLPILSGCGGAQAEVGDPSPPDIQVSTPVSRETTDKVEFIGHTESLRTITVRAMVTGYLDQVLFKEGDEVVQNQPLFKIDPRIYQAEYDQAKANLMQAQAHLKRLEADLLRAKKLLPLKAVSQEDYDKSEGDRNEAAAAVEVAEATTTYAKQNLDYTSIAAQISGGVSRQMIDPGNMVKANDTALTTIVSMDPMYAYFDVDERTMLQIRRLVESGKISLAPGGNAKVYMGLADEEGYPHEGTINFIDNQVDAPTGTMRFRGVFPNRHHLLTPGLFVRIQMPIGQPHPSLLVSERALGSDQGQKFLYVLNNDDEVTYRHVEIGALSDGLRVIEKGLKPADRVVVNGLQRVRPGMKVAAKNVAMTAEDSPGADLAEEVPPSGRKGPQVNAVNTVKAANSRPAEKARPGMKSAAIF